MNELNKIAFPKPTLLLLFLIGLVYDWSEELRI